MAVLGKWDGEVLNADVVTVTRGHGGEAEGVLEAGEVFEADELVDEMITSDPAISCCTCVCR